MPAATTEPAACVSHPEVTRHVVGCRFCERPVCPDCRELRPLGGSGIQVPVCHACVAREVRTRTLKRAGIVAAVLVAIALAASFATAPSIAVLPLAIAGVWLLIAFRRFRGGVAGRREAFNVAWILGRFLR